MGAKTALAVKLTDPWWRLNNLYFIKNKQGQKIRFKLNWAQRALYSDMWYLNLILKARQMGLTTFIQIFMLDRALFNDNLSMGIVAHNREDAEEFFEDKIKYAYDNLPEDLRAMITAESDTVRSLKFSNGSKIRVGTSLRSGTYQYVHISEFGKMCARFPEKAEEVITGTLNTIVPGQIAFIESTAEGPFGEFYEMCKVGEDLLEKVNQKKAVFTKMDWKFFFFPWWKHPDYKLEDDVEIDEKLELYFRDLKEQHGISLNRKQKNWYVKKAAEQTDKMKQEYPSTPAEAFERNTELMIYGQQLRDARREGRITKLPIARGVPVNTFWDLGRNDYTAIWFHQEVSGKHHFVKYHQDRLRDLTYYADLLREMKEEHGWFYGRHFLPHDVEVVDISSEFSESRREILESAGVRPIEVVPKPRVLNDGIELMRKAFSLCYFDEEGCAEGLRALMAYEWTWDAVGKVTRQIPAKNWGCHGADAIRQFAQGYNGERHTWAEQARSHRTGRRYIAEKAFGGNTTLLPTYDHLV